MTDRKRGRPSLDADAPSVGVYVRMTTREYDELYSRAQRERTTIPELIRRQVKPTKG
jgi:hypothetical protein